MASPLVVLQHRFEWTPLLDPATLSDLVVDRFRQHLLANLPGQLNLVTTYSIRRPRTRPWQKVVTLHFAAPPPVLETWLQLTVSPPPPAPGQLPGCWLRATSAPTAGFGPD